MQPLYTFWEIWLGIRVSHSGQHWPRMLDVLSHTQRKTPRQNKTLKVNSLLVLLRDLAR